MNELQDVANNADMIINGYAFTKTDDNYRILNLNIPEKAIVLDNNGEILETSMDDIEAKIVLNYFARNKQFLEDDYA